jgi:hypothetical protein
LEHESLGISEKSDVEPVAPLFHFVPFRSVRPGMNHRGHRERSVWGCHLVCLQVDGKKSPPLLLAALRAFAQSAQREPRFFRAASDSRGMGFQPMRCVRTAFAPANKTRGEAALLDGTKRLRRE